MKDKTALRILVVDDDREMTSLLSDFFTRKGYRVAEARSGMQALATFQSETPTPQLVLADVKMSPVDGLELTTRLLQFTPGLPVILYSAFISHGLEKAALQAGARRLLKKPFPLDQMASLVEDKLKGPSRE